MPSSSFTIRPQRATFLGYYALAAVLAGSEILILGRALHPRVHLDYRAFYIDRTTTCLNRDRVGSYSLGETISFVHMGSRREEMRRADGMKVCGWSGPAGDGTHSLGETSRLRLRIEEPAQNLVATFEMTPTGRLQQARQRVLISVNGARLHETMLSGDTPRKVSFEIPKSVLAGSKLLDIAFDYPDSIQQSPVASNIYDRAIRLVSLRIDRAAGANAANRGSGP